MSEVISPVPGMEVTVNVTGGDLPTGGTPGQVLTRTESGIAWSDLPEVELPEIELPDNGLPEGGNPGDVLVKTEDGAEWQALDQLTAEDADELLNMLK